MDEEALAETLRDQDGVVSRAQLGELGAAPHDVRRLLHRRELTRVHPGVYVDHRAARVAAAHLLTVRLTYGQVLGNPCRTARRVGAVLQRRGWSGQPSTCPECT